MHNFIPIFFDNLSFLTMALVIACFFSTGYIHYFQQLWGAVFIQKDSNHLILKRIQLIILSCTVGLYLHLATMFYFSGNIALVFHDIALFLLVIPFLYSGGFNLFERILQFGAIGYVWIAHHTGVMVQGANMSEPLVILAFTITIVLLVASMVPMVHERIIYHWAYGIIYFFLLGFLFWETLPQVSMNIKINHLTSALGIIIFVAMNVIVLIVWPRGARNESDNYFEKQADYDTLTKAKSFALFKHDSNTAFHYSTTVRMPLTVIEWDIDRFKQINDNYGHSAGNQILMDTTKIVQEALKNADIYADLYRTGGEEFTIIIPDCSSDQALPLMKKIWNDIRTTNFYYNSKLIEVTISMGGTELRPEDENFNTIYNRADQALYHSKRNGRNQVTLDDKTIYSGERRQQVMAMFAYLNQPIVQLDGSHFENIANELVLQKYDFNTYRWHSDIDFRSDFNIQIDLINKLLDPNTATKLHLNVTLDQMFDPNNCENFIATAKKYSRIQFVLEINDLNHLKPVDHARFTKQINFLHQHNVLVLWDDVKSQMDFTILKQVDGIKYHLKTYSNLQLQIQQLTPWIRYCQDHELISIVSDVSTKEQLTNLQGQLGIIQAQGPYFGIPELPTIS
ncbi:diguanylate cyclase [Weissella kandleri]|uniref:bifunctional diguanylate cyclase/phosphodiesterase n=1 Tax=Weissella kandleri TaxID=1616 RepID=UPI00387E9888